MNRYREIPVGEYPSALGADGQLVDVREPMEVAAGTLPGAINIPLGELPARFEELDRSRPVVLVCRSGVRSMQAARFLTANGFGDVVNLSGGLLAYQTV